MNEDQFKSDQFKLVHLPKTGLFSLHVKGINFTVSKFELDSLLCLIMKVTHDVYDPKQEMPF